MSLLKSFWSTGLPLTMMDDRMAADLLVTRKKCNPEGAKALLRSWRALADAVGHKGSVVRMVPGGFTLKEHASVWGPCYQNWQYVQSWELPAEEPTKGALVFWIPQLVSKSIGNALPLMQDCLTGVRNQYALPAEHIKGFGRASLLSLLMLDHHKRTGKRILVDAYAMTDTVTMRGQRLMLGHFDKQGLRCDRWPSRNSGDKVGFFLVGEELLAA